MTDQVVLSPRAFASRADWMRAIAGELNSAGLAADVRETFAWLDVTATARQSSYKDPEVSLDADGYSEIRWWNDPAATPAEVAARISRVLTAASQPTISGPDGVYQAERAP